MKRLYFTAAIIAIVLVFFAATSCKTTKFVAPEVTDDMPTQEMNVSIIDTTYKSIVLDSDAKYGESDPFLLVGAKLDGKILEIEVEYSGGCSGDTWTLVWNGTLMKSLPPKANIWLHLKNEDACRSIVRKKLHFDISSVHTKEVVLMLKDFRGELVYKP